MGLTNVNLRKTTLFGYGAGDIGFNLYWTGLSVYLLFYYTDILKIEPLMAGLIFSISIFWDAITDPIMGYIATRTRTRWGRFRPYILLGAPFIGISFVMMFAAPIIFPGAIIAASAISHIAFRTLFTVVSIPYSALSAVLTTDSTARSKLAGVRMFGAIGGSLLATIMMPSLAAELGGDNIRLGWALVSAVFALVATMLMGLVFITTRENAQLYDSQPHLKAADSVKFVTSNHALWIICAGMTVTALSQSAAGKSLVYFIKYNLDAEAQTGGLLGLQAIGAMLSLPFWIWYAGRTSKRLAWVTGSLLLAVLELYLYFSPPTDAASLARFLFVIGFLFGPFIVMFWAMVPDTVEYGQWHSGIRDEGMAFSLGTFSQKAGVGLGVGLLGIFLQNVGYVADVEQSEQVLKALRRASFLLPAICLCTTALIVWFYPIDRAAHAKLIADIDARDQATV
ncbi:MAG: glycoside-pentoside-hexuronide (GPH):cation symporter [Hyphomonadaceae bacterium]